MRRRNSILSWAVLVGSVASAVTAGYLVHVKNRVPPLSVQGAVIRQDADLKKEIPIADVQISIATTLGAATSASDASGFFWIALPPGIQPRQPVTLLMRHGGYQPLQVSVVAGDKSYVARMVPISHETSAVHHPETVVGNVDVRYSIKSTAVENVGSVVRTFQAVNKGNVPCNGHNPCSPDGRWQAATGSLDLDAGAGNQFRNARVSCIAGPCPFTRIDANKFSHDGRNLAVSAVSWSDTATFLLEAEVDRPMVSDTGRESYPVTFGDALTFTLPAGADGVFIEAELNGAPIVFPMSPNLTLSWADCSARIDHDQAKAYRCALKPGFRFQ